MFVSCVALSDALVLALVPLVVVNLAHQIVALTIHAHRQEKVSEMPGQAKMGIVRSAWDVQRVRSAGPKLQNGIDAEMKQAVAAIPTPTATTQQAAQQTLTPAPAAAVARNNEQRAYSLFASSLLRLNYCLVSYVRLHLICSHHCFNVVKCNSATCW